MSKKSLEEIWRKMDSQRRAQAQIEAQRERELFEKRELARREYLNRIRMFEKLGPITPTSASSAAGGRIPRPEVPTIQSQQSFLYYEWNETGKLFTYFIKNFETGELTDIKTIDTFDNSLNLWAVNDGGFFLSARDSTSSFNHFAFISLNGEVIWQDTSDNLIDVDIEDFVKYIAAYYLKDGIWKLAVFDKNSNIRTFNFDNPIEGGGYSFDDVWKGGFVVKEFIGTVQKYYIINFEQGTATLFKEIDTDLGDSLSVYLYSYSDKIVSNLNGTLYEVWNSSGTKISEFDTIIEFSTSSWTEEEFVFLDDDGGFLVFGIDVTNVQWTTILFNSNSSSFVIKSIDKSLYSNHSRELSDQKNYKFNSTWIAEGAAFVLFYDSTSSTTNIMNYYNNAAFLPIWSTDTTIRDLFTFSSERGVKFNDSGTIGRNSDYINVFIDNDSGDSNYSILRFEKLGTYSIFDSGVPKTWDNYNDTDFTQGRSILQLYKDLTITNVNYGWDDLSDVEDRFYYSFRQANNNNIGDNVVGQEFVMKDTVNDQYWAIKFTDWEDGGGGGFAYTRQLIEGGTFSGEVITFTHSSFLDSPDVIVPGVLEIKRGEYGPIYNSAAEGESNGDNPVGTLWNSQYSSLDIQEYVHFIINRSGEIIDEVITGDRYVDNWVTQIYTLEDEIFGKFYVSNETTVSGASPSIPGQFQLLDDYYDDFNEGSSPTYDTGLSKSNILINSGFRFRFVTNNSIGDEVIVPSTGTIFTKLNGSEAFDFGFYMATYDEVNTNFYIYNLQSSLVFQKSVSDSDLSTWTSDMMGKRMSIRYKLNSTGIWYVIIFDGQTIQELEISLGDLNTKANDWNW